VEFTFSNFGGMFRPFQNRVELARLLEHVVDLKPTNIVEIGTARGGTLFLLSCVANPAARIVSIDLPAGLYGGGYPTWKGYLYRKLMGKRQRLHLIRGNSHDDDIIRKAVDIFNGEPIDLLFIDGDHSYCGAKSDFLRYRTHVREGGWIVFHDILHNIHDKDITVAPLWREVVGKYQSTEIVESYDQGQFGLGVITSPAVW
jgi:predicted O-methyltransferase YrrM